MSTTTIYKCDICDKEITPKNKIILRTPNRYCLYDNLEFDVCPNCLEIVKHFIDEMKAMR